MRPLAMVALALACAGCGAGPGGGDAAPSPYGEWRLVGGTGPAGAVEPLDTHPVTLVVEDGRVGGTAACNSYGGSARIDGERLEVRDLAQTEMACDPPEVMELEAAYLQALGRADSIGREGDELVVSGPSVELRFEPVPDVPDAALSDTEWELDTLIEGETASTPAADASVRFAGDGTFAGTTGCRSFEGAYAVNGDDIRVERLELEDDGCEGAVAAQDDLVVRVLGEGFRTEVEGHRLTLTSRGDGLVYRSR